MQKHLFAQGHTACAGCGQAMAARIVADTVGPQAIYANSTGCLEVFSCGFPNTSWEVPWIHSLFENSAAVASGVEAALDYQGKLADVRVVCQAGDGGTADIGLQSISGMLERGHDILCICYDNEAYMNTGIQRSGLTPFDTNTTTSPPGKQSFGNPRPKKNIIGIVAAHNIPYAVTASVGYPRDLEKKVKEAISIRGPKYLQIHVPCPLGWRHDPGLSVKIAQLAVETGLYPLIEYVDGELGAVRKLKEPKPVQEYLKPQGRYKHLFAGGDADREIAKVQAIADANIQKYGLLAKKEEKKA